MSEASATASIRADGAARPRAAPHVSLGLVGRVLVSITVFSSAIVYREPAPYEILAVATVAFFFAVAGLAFARETLPAVILLLLFVVGGLGGPIVA
ncbi:MAG TPA: hypothetical protein PLG99_10410, partial [Kaistiaceae bacterium]|nr:hypothetical protein [Kaistiaceae bacterium]